MQFISLLYTIALALAIINMVTVFVAKEYRKDMFTDNIVSDSKWNWKDRTQTIIFSLSMVITICFLLWCKFTYQSKIVNCIFIIMTISFFLQHFSHALSSAEAIGCIVKDVSQTRLSATEINSITIFAVAINIFFQFKTPEKLISILRKIDNKDVSNWLMLSLYVALISIGVFLICSLLVPPIQLIIRTCRKLNSRWTNKRIQRADEWIKQFSYGKTTVGKFTVLLFMNFRQKSIVIKILICIIAPMIFICDIIFVELWYIVSITLEMIHYVYVIIRQISKSLLHLNSWFISKSNRRLVAFSFRISVILGLILTVFLSYYDPFLYNRDKNGLVFEFVSSTIVIPMIFEWILSYKQSHEIS